MSNAGISHAALIEDHTVEQFDQLFATNVRSTFFVVQQLLPVLGEGSSVILVSSLDSRAVPGNPGQADAPSLPAYAATKGAIDTLVKHWASLFGGRGIRVNAVARGIIADQSPVPPGWEPQYRAAIPDLQRAQVFCIRQPSYLLLYGLRR